MILIDSQYENLTKKEQNKIKDIVNWQLAQSKQTILFTPFVFAVDSI